MLSVGLSRLVKHIVVFVSLGLCFGLSAYVGISLTRDGGRIAAVWVPNAILLCVLLRAKRSHYVPLIATCFASNIVANVAVGDSVSIAFLMSSINVVEVTVALLLLNYFKVLRPNFAEYREIGVFALTSVAACSVSAICAAIIISGTLRVELSGVFWEWFRADALGLLIVTPAMTILFDAWCRRHKLTQAMLVEGVLVIAIGTTVSVYTFWQTKFPFLFLDAPIVLLYAFRLGSFGNAIAILNLAIVASVATTYGHGPINLVRGDLSEKLFVLQVFLASSFAIGLPIAALLRSKRLAEDRFRQIAELSPVGIFRRSSTGELRYANVAFWDKVGSREELAQSLFWKNLSQMPRGKNEFAVFQKSSGRTIRVRSQTIDNENGDDDGILGAVIDITTETASQKRLAEAKRTFETLSDLSPAGIFRTAADGTCTYVNRAWEKLAGIDAFCAIGKGWIRSLHPDDRERVVNMWHAATGHGQAYADEFRFVHASGSVRWAAVMARPEKRSDDNVVAYVGVAVDITDRKATEEKLLEARRLADHAAASKAQFLANMSHEIRTPMNGVLGFAQVLAEEDLTEPQRRMVELIVHSGKSMLDLLNDILDVSKMESGKLTLAPEAIDVREQIGATVEGLRALAQSKDIALTCDFGNAVPSIIKIDPLRLRQILNNVIGNAIKFTDEGSVSIYVSLDKSVTSDQLKIRVTDTGVGIAPEKLEKIFGYFEQADAGVTNRFGGTGLGLAITKNLVAGFGGSVEVQSGVGSGSTFNIRLPIVQTQDDVGSIACCESGTDDREIRSVQTSLRLLVAEDNEINALVLQSMLARLGLEATVVGNGIEVLKHVDKAQEAGEPFDLVLMDLRMPEMDGFEATRRLRQNGYSAEVLPIVALTANSFADDIEACLKVGMQAHLAKPLEFSKLKRALADFGQCARQGVRRPNAMNERLTLAYEAQRDRMFDNLELSLQSPSGFNAHNLLNDMHQLSGTAAYFGEPELGEACRRGEAALRRLSGAELEEELKQLLAFQRVSR